MLNLALPLAALVGAGAAFAAPNCDAIRAQVDAKIRASGVSNFTLNTVASDAPVTGKVVGTCDLGTRKIVYVPGPQSAVAVAAGASSASRSAPVRAKGEPMLTECKDGSSSLGGDCKK
jgi:Protein of unknown function (DUF1161)